MSKRVNKILILFLFSLVVMFFITWELLQSSWMAKKISELTTSYAEQVFDAEVHFENLEFNMYPPGAKLKNLTLVGNEKGVKFNLRVESVGAFFNPLDVFSTTFKIDHITVDRSKIEILTPKTISNKGKGKASSSPLDFFDHLGDIPINSIRLSNSVVKINDDSFHIENIKAFNKRDFLDFELEIKNILLKDYIGINQTIDSVFAKGEINRFEVKVNEAVMKTGLVKLTGKGKIKNYVSRNINYALDVNGKLPINSIHDWFEFKSIGELHRGIAEIQAKVSGQKKKFSVSSSIELKDFNTDFLYGDLAKAQIELSNEKIVFNSASIRAGEQKAVLVQPFEFLNLSSQKFVEDPIIVNVEKLKMDNFLSYLKDETSFMKGELSGKVKFDLPSKDYFSFTVDNNAIINSFKIHAGDELDIIRFTDFNLKGGVFAVENGVFKMSTLIQNEKTNVPLTGEVGKDKLFFDIPLAFLELDKFDSIVNEKVSGQGTLSLSLNKVEDELIIKTKKDFKDFSIFGYKLEKAKADVSYLLDRNEILAEKIQAKSGNSELKGIVKVNYQKNSIEGNYQVNQISFAEAKKILGPTLENLNIANELIQGTWDLKGQLSGLMTAKDIFVGGKVRAKNVYLYDENFDNLAFNYLFENANFQLDNLRARKGRGLILGGLAYNLNNDLFSFSAKVKSLLLQDLNIVGKFPTTLKGVLSGSLKGKYENSKWDITSGIKLGRSSALSKKLDDSYFDLKLNEDFLSANLRGFGGKILFESDVRFKKNETSRARLDLKFDDIKDALILISGVDLLNMDIEGSVDYTASGTFDFHKMKISNLNLNTKEFNFSKGPVDVRYYQPSPEIIVKDGKINKWKTGIRGKNFYILSKGDGDLFGDYQTETQIKFDASMVEVFNNWISKANGNIRGKFLFGSKDEKPIYEAFLVSRDLSFTSSFLPTDVTKADLRLSFNDNKVNIKRFKAQLISGLLDVNGVIDLNRIIPDINLNYKFQDAGFVVLKKSNLIFSGEGDLIGKNFPYTLSGDFYIQKFALINELTDFGLSGSEFSSSDIDFLPNKSALIKNQILNFNLNILTREPIFVRNSLADLGFVGNLQVLGGEQDIRLLGKVNLAPRNNKVTFKNNDFNFTKGNIVFSSEENYKNPTLDFMSSTTISDTEINAQLIGPVKDFDFKLSSNKDLTQSDILSLIIFGYTEDLSNNLSDAEKESMTRAGVGSIIFDSFKINETLKDEFGLQVNLGTEIEKEEGNYLSQKNSDASSGRVSSATTFEVKKKINDATSVSVLSTVSSSSTQKRAVNVNYKINQSVSVEGVYESREKDESEVINDESSIGADIKWKWSFK